MSCYTHFDDIEEGKTITRKANSNGGIYLNPSCKNKMIELKIISIREPK